MLLMLLLLLAVLVIVASLPPWHGCATSAAAVAAAEADQDGDVTPHVIFAPLSQDQVNQIDVTMQRYHWDRRIYYDRSHDDELSLHHYHTRRYEHHELEN